MASPRAAVHLTLWAAQTLVGIPRKRARLGCPGKQPTAVHSHCGGSHGKTWSLYFNRKPGPKPREKPYSCGLSGIWVKGSSARLRKEGPPKAPTPPRPKMAPTMATGHVAAQHQSLPEDPSCCQGSGKNGHLASPDAPSRR